MKKLIPISLVLAALGASVLGLNAHKQGEAVEGDYAPAGMVAYAASYSSSPTSEPKWSTQNNKTFQYLNLGDTLNQYRGDSVKVGIIDSGINYDHEDFMVSGSTKVKGTSKYYSYQNSKWYYYGATQHGYSYIDDSHGHGTNVAATVAAAINNVGGLGLAPNVELYVYKVTNANNGYEFGAIQLALSDAVSLGLDVINMSFQSYEHAVSYGTSSMGASSGCSTIMSSYLNQAYNAGITLVGAAGNYNTSEPSYPGSNNHVINVGSLDQSGTGKAGFSNYGSTIDLVAPGYVHVASKSSNTGYTDTSGTSFSAPLVTAAIALYKQKHPSATPAEIESALYASCDPITSGSTYPNWAGHGALNVANFLGTNVNNVPTDIVINNPEIEDEELSLEVGETLDLSWTVNGKGIFDNSVKFYTFSGKNDVVSVNSNGKITAIDEGTEYVVVESNVDPSVYASIYVTVTKPSAVTPTVSSVSVSPSSLSLDLNGIKTGNLTATVNGNNNPPQTVSWSSSNTSKATVSSSGVVTAKAIGTVTITARSTFDNSKTGSCTVTISDSTVHVTSVSLNKTAVTISKGASENLVATVLPNNATNKDVTWTSSNTSKATVSENGVVTAVDSGSATITVTTKDGSKTATCNVTINDPSSQTLVITRSSFSTAGGYNWYEWVQSTSDSTSISGQAELYTTNKDSMQFNKGNGDKIAAIYNTTEIPGAITKIEATSYSATVRSWTAYVMSSSCSVSNATLTFGSNKTTVGSASPSVGTSTSFGTTNAGYGFFCLQEGVNSASYLSEIKITYTPKTIASIVVKTAPTKTEYEIGEYFDPTGLVLTINYTDSTTRDVAYSNQTASAFSFAKGTNDQLTLDDSFITITYGGKSVTQSIDVSEVKTLSSISVSGYETNFVEGDSFNFGGIVTAHFSDNSSKNVTLDSVFSGYDMTLLGSQKITASYTFKEHTEIAEYQINVEEGTLSSISVSSQTTEFQKNHPFSFDGICLATFENGYQKEVTPTSVSSPNMSAAGEKEVTVSLTYNGVTKTTKYNITVLSNRTVIEDTETTQYADYGSVVFKNSSETKNPSSLTVTKDGYTNPESAGLRLGSGGNSGSVTITATSNVITKVVVKAKSYGSDSSVHLVVGGSDNTITSSFANYTKEFETATNSVTINTTVKEKRAYIESVTLYKNETVLVPTDISSSEDCQGLEVFIDNNMHMDYTENLGYCMDSEHHYYSTAKASFNALNLHQRTLFTTNSAYEIEWARLSAWAEANGESLDQNNQLSKSNALIATKQNDKPTYMIAVIVFALVGLTTICIQTSIRKRKEN